MELEAFLEKKGAEYAPFDKTRAGRIFKNLNLKFKFKPIHIIGTNGKGSTGRFLALMLKELGYNVGHFTSPHLLELGERFWLNGKIATKQSLQTAFRELYKPILEEASYFETLTFLALIYFKDCDYLVLEAGLGGEFDSTTACIDEALSLFTSIGKDHEELLGKSIEEIATTKLKAMKQNAILGIQNEKIVGEIAQKIAKEKGVNLQILLKEKIEKNVWDYIKIMDYPAYQAENLYLAYIALKTLGLEFNLENLPSLDLQGRMQKIQSNIYLDVLHNPLGAKKSLEYFSKEKLIIVYNSYLDKNPKEILGILKPIIKRVEILEVSNLRIIDKKRLEDILRELDISYKYFKEISKEEKYLVCGSFSVVGEFLKRYVIEK
ncbi:bifunctional folylpolyglutamate synthase/dihydrofolate synthase [Helicobacter valdiviensis]|uniref:Bifunctional folylpolyglutamate synthase/dihydrofolate synthase n=1 Tax=Helicobacter valdiviensis TaxID=1458358 RepID=A0A2W6MXR7_9HELI|nr:Mur ligase family protein [Helicobacter valdiviensis]PZT48008.1 bifunctional folylpolyglutamate synthase/dihydrofolate synthase [Helicobacter valdiviensis]